MVNKKEFKIPFGKGAEAAFDVLTEVIDHFGLDILVTQNASKYPGVDTLTVGGSRTRDRDMQYRQTKAQEKIAIKGEELVAVLNVANKFKDIVGRGIYGDAKKIAIIKQCNENLYAIEELTERVEALEPKCTTMDEYIKRTQG